MHFTDIDKMWTIKITFIKVIWGSDGDCTTCPGTYLISYKFYIQKLIIVYYNYNGGEAEYNGYKDKKMKSTVVINVKIFYKMIP